MEQSENKNTPPVKPKFDYVKVRAVRSLRTALGQQVKQHVEVTDENQTSTVRSWPAEKWQQMTKINTKAGLVDRFPDFNYEMVEAIPRPSEGDILSPEKTGGAETTAMKNYEAALAAYNESIAPKQNGKQPETTTKP